MTGPLRIATGTPGGIYDLLGTAYAAEVTRQAHVRASAVTTGASIENLRLVATGQADLGFTATDAAALAIAGSAPFPQREPITALAALYDDYVQVVVPGGSRVTGLRQLAGRRVSLGAAGSGSELVAERLLRLAGISRRHLEVSHLGASDSARSLLSGSLDAFFFSGGVPTPAIARLAQARSIRLLPLGQYVDPMRRRYGGTYHSGTVQVAAYSGATSLPVPTLRILNVLVAARGMREDDAFELTRLLFRAVPALVASNPAAAAIDASSATATFPVPLHPGAARYYRERKVATAARR